MKINDFELGIFDSLDELKETIKRNFNVEDMEEVEHEDPSMNLDDELAFCDGEFDYSLYYMKGKSGRIIVVETNKSHY